MAETPSRPPGRPTVAGLPSFADRLFLGQFAGDELMPYFEQLENAAASGDSMVAKTKNYCQEFVFPDRIDQHMRLPAGIIKGMGNLGVTGMTVEKELGGNEMSTFNFCRVLEVLGGHCGSTAAMVRLQSCVVLNLLRTYGSTEQQRKWIPGIASGDQTGALAITEELAGSDFGNVHTAAEPQSDGKGYKITGKKRWIANGSEADLLIVLARTPDDYLPWGNVSAFLVPGNAEGVSIDNCTQNKLGLKGVSVATIAFENVVVAGADLLGSAGAAVAMVEKVTVLDRIASAATAVGVLKSLLQAMVIQAQTRTQFGKTIGSFGQVKQKIAEVAANLYALEATVYHVASQYDCDRASVTRESQMLKLFSSQSLWSAVNDAMDVLGGNSVFKTNPLERVMRDVRHSLISEGSNDLLKQQIAGQLNGIEDAAPASPSPKHQWWNTAGRMLPTFPTIDVKHEHLRFHARWLANHIGKFGRCCRSLDSAVEEDGLQKGRVAELATNLLVSSCTFAKLSALMVNGTIPEPEKQIDFDAGSLFLQQSKTRDLDLLEQLNINLDGEKAAVADHWLTRRFENANGPLPATTSEKPKAQ